MGFFYFLLYKYPFFSQGEEIEADDQAIQTILLGLPEDIYAVVDSCETAQEIWLRVQQMMKGSDIRIHEKKAKLFNEWERFTSNNGESIESYYHRFLKLMNDLKRNKHFPDKIASQDRQMQMVGGNGGNKFRQYTGQKAGNPAGYNDVIENQVMQNAVQNLRVQNVGNQNGLIGVQGNGNHNQIVNSNLVAARAEGNAAGQNGNHIRCYNCRGKEEAEIQLQAEEYDLMAAAADLDEIKKVNANCILMANLQKASTLDGSAEVHENCDENEIFNMFTQKEQFTELLEPIPESHKVPQNNNDVISEDTSVEQGGKIVEQH
nr:hypothetical protein [Tanacetum cinerariifolium]